LHDIGCAFNGTVGTGTALDRVQHIQAFGDFAHDGILPVQEIPLIEHDEELRVGGIRVLAARHTDDTPVKGQIRKLGRQVGHVRTTHTGPAGVTAGFAEFHITGLRHEAVDDTVKHDTIIGPLLCQCLEPLDVLGRYIFKQIDLDQAMEAEIAATMKLRTNQGTLRAYKATITSDQ